LFLFLKDIVIRGDILEALTEPLKAFLPHQHCSEETAPACHDNIILSLSLSLSLSHSHTHTHTKLGKCNHEQIRCAFPKTGNSQQKSRLWLNPTHLTPFSGAGILEISTRCHFLVPVKMSLDNHFSGYGWQSCKSLNLSKDQGGTLVLSSIILRGF